MHALGIDPGKTVGGAALLDGRGKLVQAWLWKERKHGYKLTSNDGDSFVLASLNEVGLAIAQATAGYRYLLTVEGLFVGKNKKTSMVLAEATGEVLGPLRLGAVGEVRRPLANARGQGWREVMLSTRSPGPAGAWEALAIQMAERIWGRALGALSKSEHVCEAAWMARFGQLQEGVRHG